MTHMTVTVHANNLLTANQRLHYHRRAEVTRILRHTAAQSAEAQGVGTFDRAHVVVTVTWPDRRRRDVLNIAPTVKALIDGITDAGCWPDDNDAHLVGPDFRVSSELSGIKGVTRLSFAIVEASENGAEMVGSEHNKTAPGSACDATGGLTTTKPWEA